MKKKLSRKETREQIQNTLEGYRRFDYDYIPFGKNWKAPDETYPYKKYARIGFMSFLLRGLMATLGALAIKMVYGAKVTGKKNLKALKKKGAICVCNHFAFLDTLFIRLAVGNFRSYHTMAPWNNKNGLGGFFIRRGGMIPLGGNLAATRNLNSELERLLKKGKIVNFYAEQAMWMNYQKPRPMKDGAFYYADKFSVPVLPVFCTFKKSKRGHIKRLRINVLPPVYGDESLPKKARINKMKEESEARWKACYKAAYGKELCYLPDRRKNGDC